MYYDHKRADGKNHHFHYFVAGLLRELRFKPYLRRELPRLLDSIERRPDAEYIHDRADYYNKLRQKTPLGEDSVRVGDFSLSNAKSIYYLDTSEYLRYFDGDLRFNYLFGDIIHVPPHPAILKSRPIEGDNAASVLLNLDKVRHFTFLKDEKPFAAKADCAVFRGHISGKPHRVDFVRKFFGSPLCDVGVINPRPEFPPLWSENKSISLWRHLDYKFVVTLEGNDVASNLKWVMSSNSVAVMPRPKYETWFMEGRLIPEHHYIEISDDYSDFESKIRYYLAHPDRAEAISRNANEWVRQFLDPQREKLISLAVLKRYFEMTY